MSKFFEEDNNFSIQPPTLHTQNLIVDRPRLQDFEGYRKIVTTERGQWIGGPFSESDAWLDYSQMVAGWILRGHGALSARKKSNNEYIGTVLVHHEYGDPEPELGFLFTEEAEGKGLAFEASAAIRDWAFSTTQLTTLVSYIHSDNLKAINLAKRLGGKLEPQTYKNYLTFRYRVL